MKIRKPLQPSIWLSCLFFAFLIVDFSSSVRAVVVEPGLDVTVYDNSGYYGSPPLPEVSGSPVVGTITQSDIDHNFDSEPLFNLSESFIVKYEGYITSPITGDIVFLPTADDGTKFFLDGILIDDNWVDKGGGGNTTEPQPFTADTPRQITYWFYENGGGAFTMLYWDIGNGWEVVPASAFTKTEIVSVTTTTTTTTTTTVAPYFNTIQNLTATPNQDGSVFLDWDAPTTSNTNPYMYNILFYDLVNGVESGGWGVWTYAENTSYSLGPWMWSGTTGYGPVRFKIQAGTAPCVGEGDGSCLYGPQASVDVTVIEPITGPTTTVPATTTTTQPLVAITTTTQPLVATSTTTTEVSTTTTSSTTIPYQSAPSPSESGLSDGGDSSPTGTTLPPEPTPESEQESTPETLPEETLPENEQPSTTIPEEWESTETTLLPIEVGPEEPETEEIESPSDEPTPESEQETISDGELEDILDESFSPDADAENVGEVLEDLFETDITDTQLDGILDAVFDEGVSEEVFTEAITTMLDADLTDEQLDEVLDSAFSEETSVENMVSALDEILDGPIDVEDLEKVMDAVFDGDLSDDETIALAEEVLKGELTADEFTTVIDAIFDEVVADEVLLATFETVLETELDAEKFEAVVGALESEVISSEQVAQVVTLIIEQEGGIPSEQATELATSAKVLESVDGEQATEVFASIVVAEVSEETGAAIAEALASAGIDVKEAFEEEINVFAGVFDTYLPLDSVINVGDRRTVIAAGAAMAIAGAVGAIGGGGPSSGGNTPNGGSGSPSGQNSSARKPEEEEPAGEIAGDGVGWITNISVFKYNNGVKVLDWSQFVKKFSYGILNLGFTISGSLVVYLTLSGSIQRIAGISSIIALMGALYLHMKEPEGE